MLQSITKLNYGYFFIYSVFVALVPWWENTASIFSPTKTAKVHKEKN